MRLKKGRRENLMIKIEKVYKKYGKNNTILNNVNLEINNNEIFGFLGPNGAGKTTLIKMIMGIVKIDEGNIIVDGYNTKYEEVEVKKRLGLIPDSADNFLNLKGIEYLNFVSDMYDVNKEQRIRNIKKLAKLFKMTDALNQKIETYSHGMRQKINIIAAFVHEPNNLIMDEPITGLDPKAIYDLKQLMIEYANQGRAVFFSTHILEVAEKMCDKVAIINKGKILFTGKIEDLKHELKENKSLEEIFMELIEND